VPNSAWVHLCRLPRCKTDGAGLQETGARGSRGGAYVPASNGASGHLLFLRGQTLMAQPFDARHLSLAGDPVRVVEEPVGQYLDSGLFSVSTTGILVYWSPGNVESQLTWLDAHGKVLRTVGPASPYGELVLSPMGRKPRCPSTPCPSNITLCGCWICRGAPVRGSSLIHQRRMGPQFGCRMAERSSSVPLTPGK
jgi:hypothetical protein